MSSWILAIGIGFAFGVSNKLADMANEHGLVLRTHISITLGMTWGALGVILVFLTPACAVYYLSLVLFWFLVRKLDYLNHSLAGVFMILGGLVSFEGSYIGVTVIATIVTFLFVTKIYQDRVDKETQERISKSRIRYWFSAGVVSLVYADPHPLIATAFGLLGVQCVCEYYARKGFSV